LKTAFREIETGVRIPPPPPPDKILIKWTRRG
jgi:hypothetical protein